MAALHIVGADAPGQVTPTNDNAPWQARVGDQKADSRDCAAKRTATLVARAALAGFELRRLADGSWLLSKWNLSKELGDGEVETWLLRAGVRT